MNRTDKKYHEVVIADDPEQKRRVAMEQNGIFYVMMIEDNKHGPEIFERDQLRLK